MIGNGNGEAGFNDFNDHRTMFDESEALNNSGRPKLEARTLEHTKFYGSFCGLVRNPEFTAVEEHDHVLSDFHSEILDHSGLCFIISFLCITYGIFPLFNSVSF